MNNSQEKKSIVCVCFKLKQYERGVREHKCSFNDIQKGVSIDLLAVNILIRSLIQLTKSFHTEIKNHVLQPI